MGERVRMGVNMGGIERLRQRERKRDGERRRGRRRR